MLKETVEKGSENTIGSRMQYKLELASNSNQYRKLVVLDNGKIDFCSNDYLGFGRFPKLSLEALVTKLPENIYGACASRLVSGNYQFAEDLEANLATKLNVEASLLTPNGYLANLAILSTIADRDQFVIYDEYVHASIRDGISLSNCRSAKFEHNNLDVLEGLLKKKGAGSLVVTESIFSMRGDRAPLLEIVELCEMYGAELIVDEAHALGILGENGLGLVEMLGLADRVFARIFGFGKALGCQGGLIAGSRILKEFLINFSRPIIYSTFMPPIQLGVIDHNFSRLEQASEERIALNKNVEFYECCAQELGISLENSQSPIKTLTIADTELLLQSAKLLESVGFLVRAIRYPTVPKGSELLRVVLHSFNTSAEIKKMLSMYLECVGEKLRA